MGDNKGGGGEGGGRAAQSTLMSFFSLALHTYTLPLYPNRLLLQTLGGAPATCPILVPPPSAQPASKPSGGGSTPFQLDLAPSSTLSAFTAGSNLEAPPSPTLFPVSNASAPTKVGVGEGGRGGCMMRWGNGRCEEAAGWVGA